MLAIKAIVKDGLIKPLETIDLQEGKEIIIYISEEKEEHSDWVDEDWQRFSLHSFVNTDDDKEADWEDFFNVKNRRHTHCGIFTQFPVRIKTKTSCFDREI